MAEARWIGVYECMPTMKVKKSPEEGCPDYLISDYVLVWDGVEVSIAHALSDESGLYWLDRYGEVVEVVSWMPLPTPPERSDGR